MTASLTDEQQRVFDTAMDFVSSPPRDRNWFSIEGLAGTGKSHVLAALARAIPNANLCALFGKAARNISLRSGLEASTIHATLYRLEGEDLDERGRRELRFSRALRDGALRHRVLLVDESGTVPVDVGRDIERTGALVVAAGDPGQLPPVKGRRYFNRADMTLTEVHRQAWDSPIIRQAHAVREGRGYRPDGDGFQVVGHVDRDTLLEADIVLCWRNATRRQLNALKRAHLGLPPDRVLAGEPLMCLLNARDLGLMNGAVCTLTADYVPGEGVRVGTDGGRRVCVGSAWVEGIDDQGRQVGDRDPETGDPLVPFALGHAATVHKAIGSEFDSVVLMDEYDMHKWRREWVYTGLTRAVRRCTVLRAGT